MLIRVLFSLAFAFSILALGANAAPGRPIPAPTVDAPRAATAGE